MTQPRALAGGVTEPPAGFAEVLLAAGLAPTWDVLLGDASKLSLADATTVLVVRYADGVYMVGDRQATEGYSVAHRRMKKVFPSDDFSAVAISGTAGLAIELVRLFQTELEHYEKLEGTRLSLEGRANFLARLVRQQLPMAFQGLVVVPLFCGFDHTTGSGRLFTFDVVGGRYEEDDFGASGSGAKEARSYLRSHFDPTMGAEEGLSVAIKSLVAAAEQDVATSGPDVRRGIYPNVIRIDVDGLVELSDEVIAPVAEAALEVVR
ncbi:MAG: proteasome subunit beta [Acidimicrobiia bacterium]|nr:proteasome subunit beta [Acidimicrobiia bacterium]